MRIIEGSGGDRVNITTAERVSERKRARRGGNKRREAKRKEEEKRCVRNGNRTLREFLRPLTGAQS